jgi:hypothetical protein
MLSGATSSANVSERLRSITNELREIEELLISEQLEMSVLTDFRDAVNRVRTTAWAVAQALEADFSREQCGTVLTLLANERVRVTYRLCRLIDADLANGTVDPAILVQLYLATQDLGHRIGETLGRGPQVPRQEATVNRLPAADAEIIP